MSEQEKNTLEQGNEKQNTAVEAKKAKKPAEKKPNALVRAGHGLVKWLRDLKSEAKKVVWPTGKHVFNNTVVVLIAIIVVALFVYVLDVAFGFVRDLIVQLV